MNEVHVLQSFGTYSLQITKRILSLHSLVTEVHSHQLLQLSMKMQIVHGDNCHIDCVHATRLKQLQHMWQKNSLYGTQAIPALLMSRWRGRFLSLKASVKSFVDWNEARSSCMYSTVSCASGRSWYISSFMRSMACIDVGIFDQILWAYENSLFW